MKPSVLCYLLTLLTLVYSCAEEPTAPPPVSTDLHIAMQQVITSIEYSLYKKDRSAAVEYLEDWIHLLNRCDDEFCAEDQAQFANLVSELATYHNSLQSAGQELALDRLRMLKAHFMNLNTVAPVQTYLYDLWKYEEDMYYATKTAMDPMLDLYEWNEFEAMTLCLTESWDRVQLHYPSLELLYEDQLAYKMQTLAKVELQAAMKQFDTAVKNDDYHTDTLAESAAHLRTSYIRYLMTLTTAGSHTSEDL